MYQLDLTNEELTTLMTVVRARAMRLKNDLIAGVTDDTWANRDYLARLEAMARKLDDLTV